MRADKPSPNAVLVGGPQGVSEVHRLRWVDNSESEVKYRNGNRYDHFVSTTETTRIDDLRLRVFRWTVSTRIAE